MSMTSVGWLLLTLNRFYNLFWCFHCWFWASKCQLGRDNSERIPKICITLQLRYFLCQELFCFKPCENWETFFTKAIKNHFFINFFSNSKFNPKPVIFRMVDRGMWSINSVLFTSKAGNQRRFKNPWHLTQKKVISIYRIDFKPESKAWGLMKLICK